MQVPPQPQRPIVELFISCQNLKNLDVLTKSDPQCYLYTSDSNGKWIKFGKTEKVKNNLNPKFTTTFKLEYTFEVEQRLMFKVYDDDDDNATEDDFLGQMQTTLGRIMGSGHFKDDLLSKRGNVHGEIHIHAEPCVTTGLNEMIHFTLRGKSLAKKDVGLFAKSDPYFIIQRQQQQDQWHDIFKSEIIERNLNPTWKLVSIPLQKLCNGDWRRPLKISVWDWDKFTEHDEIGTVTTTLEAIQQAYNTGGSLKLIDQKGKNGGDLLVSSFSVERTYSFSEYLAHGCEISLVVAVDFTGSNGNPKSPSSLHYLDPSRMNEYQSAIWSIGNILAPYDSDQSFPVYGFGAFLPSGKTSHCFALNGNEMYPECHGVDGILQAYAQAISNVGLSGPTNFETFINETVKRYTGPAAQNTQALKYYVLLVLTDGEITDMSETIRAIFKAQQTPLSIVIVGVGAANFDAMEILDGDSGELKKGSDSRDIVQFVPYRRFANQGPAELARETLREIPSQLEQYFRMRRIVPTQYQRRGVPPPLQ